jgi:hypothetical protein
LFVDPPRCRIHPRRHRGPEYTLYLYKSCKSRFERNSDSRILISLRLFLKQSNCNDIIALVYCLNTIHYTDKYKEVVTGISVPTSAIVLTKSVFHFAPSPSPSPSLNRVLFDEFLSRRNINDESYSGKKGEERRDDSSTVHCSRVGGSAGIGAPLQDTSTEGGDPRVRSAQARPRPGDGQNGGSDGPGRARL